TASKGANSGAGFRAFNAVVNAIVVAVNFSRRVLIVQTALIAGDDAEIVFRYTNMFKRAHDFARRGVIFVKSYDVSGHCSLAWLWVPACAVTRKQLLPRINAIKRELVVGLLVPYWRVIGALNARFRCAKHDLCFSKQTRIRARSSIAQVPSRVVPNHLART